MLGDENNNELFDLANFDAKRTALLVIDELGVDTLICMGMDTNICVRHTLADAYFNNYNLIVAGDATATFLVGNQEEGLEYFKTCYAACVLSTDDVVALLEK